MVELNPRNPYKALAHDAYRINWDQLKARDESWQHDLAHLVHLGILVPVDETFNPIVVWEHAATEPSTSTSTLGGPS